MKGFNRKKLIPSLAASAMVAAATLAPLPGFLASGNIYAAPTSDHALVHPVVGLNVNSTHTVPAPDHTSVHPTVDLTINTTHPVFAPTHTPDHPPFHDHDHPPFHDHDHPPFHDHDYPPFHDHDYPPFHDHDHPIAEPALVNIYPVPVPAPTYYSPVDIEINRESRFIAPNTVNLETWYRCSSDSGATTINVTLTQPPAGSNTGTGSNIANVICDDHYHQAIIPVTAKIGSNFDAGKAIATAALTDSFGNPVSDQTREVIVVL